MERNGWIAGRALGTLLSPGAHASRKGPQPYKVLPAWMRSPPKGSDAPPTQQEEAAWLQKLQAFMGGLEQAAVAALPKAHAQCLSFCIREAMCRGQHHQVSHSPLKVEGKWHARNMPSQLSG